MFQKYFGRSNARKIKSVRAKKPHPNRCTLRITHVKRQPLRFLSLKILGSLLLAWSSYLHFHLWWQMGYRHLVTIGPLFLLQSVSALFLSFAVVLLRGRAVALLGIGFAFVTGGGFLLSVTTGLFSFHDSWRAPYATLSFVINVALVLVLSATALCHGAVDRTTQRNGSVPTRR